MKYCRPAKKLASAFVSGSYVSCDINREGYFVWCNNLIFKIATLSKENRSAGIVGTERIRMCQAVDSFKLGVECSERVSGGVAQAAFSGFLCDQHNSNFQRAERIIPRAGCFENCRWRSVRYDNVFRRCTRGEKNRQKTGCQ